MICGGEFFLSSYVLRHNIHTVKFFFIFLSIFYFIFQVINSALTGNEAKHLTNWTCLVTAIGSSLITYDIHRHNRTTALTAVVFPVILTQTWFVLAAMLALELQDSLILREVADDLGRPMMGLANAVAHYLTPSVLLAFCLLTPFLRIIFDWGDLVDKYAYSMHWLTSAPITSGLYVLWFNLSVQYKGNLNFWIIFGCGLSGYIFVSCFSMYILWRK